MRAFCLTGILLALTACGPNGARNYSANVDDQTMIADQGNASANNAAENAKSVSFPTVSSDPLENQFKSVSDSSSADDSSNSQSGSELNPSAHVETPNAGSVQDSNSVGSAADADPLLNSASFPGSRKTTRVLPSPAANKTDFSLQGNLTPSVYFQPLLIDNEKTCSSSQRQALKSSQGITLMRVCPKTLSTCALEGSCRISQNGIIRSFNTAGFQTFMELNADDCSYGMGVNSICLDPFYTVAADMRYHRAGEVIYVPTLVGHMLPDGSRHNGFLVVRDRGGAIKGANRFDFFSGNLNWSDGSNPFNQVNFSDKNTHVAYYVVRGASAQMILQQRNYPRMPGN